MDHICIVVTYILYVYICVYIHILYSKFACYKLSILNRLPKYIYSEVGKLAKIWEEHIYSICIYFYLFLILMYHAIQKDMKVELHILILILFSFTSFVLNSYNSNYKKKEKEM